MKECAHCRKVNSTGGTYCSESCRVSAHRYRRNVEESEQDFPGITFMTMDELGELLETMDGQVMTAAELVNLAATLVTVAARQDEPPPGAA